MKRLLLSVVTVTTIVVALPAVALAHVVVTPQQAGVGDAVLFNMSVPNERQAAVASIKLNIPAGIQEVQPDTLAGWDISTGQNSAGNVTSITWTGNIPVGQREDFAFKAQAPAQATQLDWKAYQTYADGTVVSWDQKPVANQKDDDSSDVGPYSVTKVVNDLTADSTTTASNSSSKDSLTLAFSIAALILSTAGLFLRRRK